MKDVLKIFGVVVLGLAIVAGCTGTGDDDDDDNGTPTPSASPTGTAAACTVEASIADLGSSVTFTGALVGPDGNGDYLVDIFGPINGDAMADFLDIQLYSGYGVFPTTGMYVAGTHAITGDEVDYATCGACVLIFGDVDTGSGNVTQAFMANGGTLVLDALTNNPPQVGDVVSGSVSSITVREIDQNGDVPNGCTSSLAGSMYSGTLADGN